MTAGAVGNARRSPKQQQAERKRDWYPYYAGFDARFVRHTLRNLLDEPSSVLDPWNGSGTTTAVAAELGIRSTGVDLNPAMTVIATARLHPAALGEDALRDASRAVAAMKAEDVFLSADDPLLLWLKPTAATNIRALSASIPRCVDRSGRDPLIAELRHALLTSALMAGTRDLLSRFRSKNPSWMSLPASHRHRALPSPAQICNAFLARCGFLVDRLTVHQESSAALASICTGSVSELPGDGEWASCLTSPPYATRIDYVRGTLPELAVLGLPKDQQNELRREMTGTTVVRGKRSSTADRLRSSTARQMVKAVSEHPSHGSANYYAPWIQNYFLDLDRALGRTSSTVRRDGSIAVVVQDSQYKEIHVDLQAVVVELLEASGRELTHRHDFAAPHLVSRMNARARAHASTRKNYESLLVFQ